MILFSTEQIFGKIIMHSFNMFNVYYINKIHENKIGSFYSYPYFLFLFVLHLSDFPLEYILFIFPSVLFITQLIKPY